MNPKRHFRKRLLRIAIVLLIALTLFRWLGPGGTTKPAETASGVPRPLASNDTIAAAPPARPARERKAARKAVDSERSWDLTEQGGRAFVLALDEGMLRDSDGKETLVKLDPPATDESLPQRLAGLGASPIAYLAGEPRSDATRRILTPDLRVRLDGANPETVARAAAAEIKDLPEYAPGWAVLATADAFAALDAMDRLRAAGHSSADVLLAAQRAKRAMPNDTLINNQWHLRNTNSNRTHINVESVWNYPNTGIRGAGIRIGIVDDGLQTAHPDLATNVDTENDRDWNGNDLDPNPGSGDDHGTACAGNAGARGNNNLGVSGSAPESTLVGLRLIAASVTDAQEAEAMAWKNDIIQIKSNSWGPSDTGTILEAPGPLTAAAFQNATTNGRGGRGTIFLWAGGNGGGSSDNSNYDGYANSIHTISIGASDSNGNRASYSEPGANLVVVAPSSGGTGITTTDRTGSAGYSSGDYTNTFGGTSSATPTAAGVVALMLAKNPELGWRDVQEILIRSAFKIRPTDAAWAVNGAGIPFHHNFGAGLIDASAAVNLSDGWVNLTTQQSSALAQTGLSVAIPDNNASGITRSFDFSSSNLRLEHVTVRLSVTHSYRGDLAVTLTSPSGMTSRLAERRSDSNDHYSNWTFSSVRHWGESSTGTWTLNIADLSAGSTGTLTAATLTLFGAQPPVVNPAPLVQITAPQNGAVFSPGAIVDVSVNATDLTESGSPGTITQVELLQNGNVVASDVTAPYTFAITPANGNHTLVARAIDSEGAVANSASVSISVLNQAPVITAATLSSGAQGFADEGLAVTAVNAADPENDILAYQYQWQSSTDGVTFTDAAGATTSALTAGPGLAGKLWRCVITATDAANTSAPFTTASTNLLNRAPAVAAIGSEFSHSSGLVLRGDGSSLTRQAIIHEFSQGPAGGSAEWIEILTLRAGSLANWDIQDAGGNMVVFRDATVWDELPAGTLIVIYNGTTTKDPLLPADDSDPSDGRMIVSSTNTTFFDSTVWPALGNSGDAIFLSDANSNTVHQIAYGNSTAASPNIGSVGSGQSAYYSGSNDPDANLAANWRVTSSAIARAVSTRAAGDLFISEYVEGSGNNKALEIHNPSVTPVDLAAEGYKIEIFFNGSTSAGSNINLTGTVAPGGVFVIKNNQASASINAQQASASLSFNGDDAIILRKGTSVVDSFGQVGVDPGTAWTAAGVTTVDKTLRRKPGILLGDAVANDAFDPSLEWLQFDQDDFSGLGSHGNSGPAPQLALTIAPSSFVESAGGAAATGTVSIAAALAEPLSVVLASNDTSEATVPPGVVIPGGQTSATFQVAAVDDADSDGSQNVTISASADGYTAAAFSLTVTDDETSLEGVTPGNGNNPANSGFVNQLRAGAFGNPALYRIGAGSTPPAGLTLDPESGLLAGVIAANNPPGDYLIIIERYNSLGEVVSQTFTLTLAAGSGGDFAAWIAGYPEVGQANGRLDDPDGDGLPNAVENLLGTSPGTWSPGLVKISANNGSLVFHHTLAAQPASDVTGSYEWSADLVNWHPSGVEANGTTVMISSEVVVDEVHPGGWIRVTASATQDSPPQYFVRLRAD